MRLTEDERAKVNEHRGLAGKAAKKVWLKWHQKHDFEDLMQSAMIGLCKAVRKHDPSRGVKFSSYAFKACYMSALDEAACSGLIHKPHGHTSTGGLKNPNLRQAAAAADRLVKFSVTHHDRIDHSANIGDVETQLDIEWALQYLRAEERYALELWITGKTQDEIGEQMGVSKQAVCRRLKQITAMIRDCIQQE